MRKSRLLLGLAFASMAASCRKDDPVTVDPAKAILRINVVSEWDGQPYENHAEYRAPGNYRFSGEMVRLYMGDIRLVSAAGEQAIDPVRLLDLGNGDKSMDIQVPDGEWLGIRSGIGLPAALNHTDPSTYPGDHPMSENTGMYWTWASGYKFVLFDGRYDPDPSSTGPLIPGFSVHTGMDTCYTEVDLFPALPFTTSKGAVTTLTLKVDVHGFLQSGPDTINVTTENSAHGGNYPLALKLTRNVKRSMRIE